MAPLWRVEWVLKNLGWDAAKNRFETWGPLIVALVVTGSTWFLGVVEGIPRTYLFALVVVLPFMAAFVTTQAIGFARSRSQRVAPPTFGKGFLDYAVEGPAALTELTALIHDMTSKMSHQGTLVERHTKKMLEAQGDPARMRTVASQAAQDFKRFGKQTSEHAARLDSIVPVVAESVVGISNYRSPTTEEERRGMRELKDVLDVFNGTSRGTLEMLAAYRAGVVALHGASRDMNEGIDAVLGSLDRVSGHFKRLSEATAEASGHLERRLAEGTRASEG